MGSNEGKDLGVGQNGVQGRTYDAFYARGDPVDKVLVRGMFGLDEDGGAFDDGVNGFETGGFHRFARFCAFC